MWQPCKELAIGVWILAILLNSEAQNKLPEYLTACKNDLNLSICSRMVLENLRPHLLKGIPQFQIPSIDPLLLAEMRVRRNSNIADYRIVVTNMRWTGVKDFKIAEINIDPDKLYYRLKLGFPYLHGDCDGEAEGVLVGFDVSGKGIFSIHFTNVDIDVVLTGTKYLLKGKEYIKWEREDVEINYDFAYFPQIHGFFPDPTITKLFTIAMNKSARLLGPSFRAAVDLSIGNFVVEAINGIHMSFPKDTLYPAV